MDTTTKPLPELPAGAHGYTHAILAEWLGIAKETLRNVVWSNNKAAEKFEAKPILPVLIDQAAPHAHYFSPAGARAIEALVREKQSRPRGRPPKQKESPK